MQSTSERQRNFRARLYEAGLKQVSVWVKRKSIKETSDMTSDVFMEKTDKLISDLDIKEQSNLFKLLLKIIEGKREVLKTRKNRRNL